jgi:hypothetical protein
LINIFSIRLIRGSTYTRVYTVVSILTIVLKNWKSCLWLWRCAINKRQNNKFFQKKQDIKRFDNFSLKLQNRISISANKKLKNEVYFCSLHHLHLRLCSFGWGNKWTKIVSSDGVRNYIIIRLLGGVHKWRQAIFDNFWHPPPPSSRFLVLCLYYYRHENLDLSPPMAVTSFMNDPLYNVVTSKSLTF